MNDNNYGIFKDKDFPIIVNFGRTSVINSLDDARSMLHEAIEIKYFYEGRSTLLVGNDTIVANAGDVVIMNPYEFHATVNCSEEKAKYHLIMIGLDFFLPNQDIGCDLRTLFFVEKKAFVNHVKDSKELRDLIRTLVDEYVKKPDAYRLRIRGLAFEIFALLMRLGMKTAETVGNEQSVRYHSTIEPALRKIRENYKSDLELTDLADECCVNKYYFCRIFKKAMGVTPIQYLCDYRLNNADIMLRNTDQGISDIIHSCGFRDERYFYRCYKKRFGDTPHSRRSKHSTK